jgi:hypothetical protein
MAKNKRNTRRPPAHNQQLHDNYVLALPASPLPPPPPPLLPSPPILTPSPTAVAGRSSPDKFLLFFFRKGLFLNRWSLLPLPLII